ncbi:MAG: hypothetical protein WC882_00745 [Candidatus Gracilibacteria bacterium]
MDSVPAISVARSGYFLRISSGIRFSISVTLILAAAPVVAAGSCWVEAGGFMMD